MKNKSSNKDLYITDISFDATEEDLEKLFTICGTVKHIRLLNDPRTDQFTGRAFVSMASAEQAREAVNMLDGTRLVNRCIKVKAARDKQPAAPVETEVRSKPQHKATRPKRTRR